MSSRTLDADAHIAVNALPLQAGSPATDKRDSVYPRGQHESLFVFDDIESVCFAIIYIIIFSKVCEYILNGVKKALKFEVVTEHAEELAQELIQKLGHGVTVTKAKGMYANTDKYLLICVIHGRQVADFEKILKKYPDAFAFASSVSEVFGLFFK